MYTLDEKGQPVWHYPDEVADEKSKTNGKPILTGRIEKMSKSKRNVVDPNEIIAAYGADSARLFTLFASPPENDLVWKDEGVEGVHRFLSRLWRIVWERRESIKNANPYLGDGGDLDPSAKALRKKIHKTISAVTEDIEKRFHFNTALARCMELTNTLSKYRVKTGDSNAESVQRDGVFALVGLLAPFAPHFAEELWEEIGGEGTVSRGPWPTWDEKVAADDMVTIAVQVMGKLRAKLEIPAGASREEMEKQALENENVLRHIEGKTVRKVIVVPDKLVNIVAN
jgi:leucyl-tRNA synthetase